VTELNFSVAAVGVPTGGVSSTTWSLWAALAHGRPLREGGGCGGRWERGGARHHRHRRHRRLRAAADVADVDDAATALVDAKVLII